MIQLEKYIYLSGVGPTERNSVQNRMLDGIKINNIACTVILVKGFQIKGRIEYFDDFCVILNADGKQQTIYKHSISTIIPSKSVTLMRPNEKAND
ncbi:RNA chaperone Hfq [Alicyclobacillus fodiniaquatilis]|uniref:RNA chaperone Hfq n=1 Tax=Alicyclobacillus fodiniaquatilis TaxID=1661150 RepID=A0ABW4JJ94_9BACL